MAYSMGWDPNAHQTKPQNSAMGWDPNAHQTKPQNSAMGWDPNAHQTKPQNSSMGWDPTSVTGWDSNAQKYPSAGGAVLGQTTQSQGNVTGPAAGGAALGTSAPPGYYYTPEGQMLLGSGPTQPQPTQPTTPPPMVSDPYMDFSGQPGVGPNADPTQAGWTYGPGEKPDLIDNIGDSASYLPRVEEAYYSRAAARLDPRFQQQQTALETQLANMGLTRGSEAWNREMQRLGFERNDAYSSAMNDAIMASGAEAQRLQGMDLASAGFTNTSRTAEFQQAMEAARLRNEAMAAQGQLGNQRRQIDNTYDLGIRTNETNRYGIDRGAEASMFSASQNAAAAAAAAAANRDVGMRGLDLRQSQQEWDQMMQGMFLPYQLQNFQMNGMYPSGMPGAPSFSPVGPSAGGNYLQGAAGQNAQNQNTYNAWGTLGGAILGNVPWGRIF